MASIQAVNVLTGATEVGKYNATGVTAEIWKASTTTSLASGDVIHGPIIPAGCFVVDVVVAVTDIDSGSAVTFEAGYSGAAAAFIATGNTTGQAGGIAHANVPGALGFSASTNTEVLVTMTGTAGTPVAGSFTIAALYTASP